MTGPMTLEQLNEAIQRAVSVAIERELERGIQEATERAKQRIPEIVAGCTLHLCKYIDLRNMMDHIQIRVSLDGETSNGK